MYYRALPVASANQLIRKARYQIYPNPGFRLQLEHNGEEFYVGPENQILARVKSTVADVLAETEVTPEEEKAINDIKIEDNE